MSLPDKRDEGSDAPTVMGGSAAVRAPSSAPAGKTPSSGVGAAAASLEPGTVLADRYTIVELLGQGGMGAVYKAQDRELDRLVALKTIRSDLAAASGMLQRFKQELILARQITHRNVIRIYDLGEAAGLKFITMEYVEGQDLASTLREHGKFSPAEAVAIIQQVCRALEAAHSEGVIHRDLKPQNVMRDAHGRVLVMDFGLARSLGVDGMTQTGALLGTMEYMSPEQALGEELTPASDLFAVGLIFYELLTGRVPYKADSALASLLKRTRERAIPASDVDTAVPRSLSNLVSRCLERDLKQRYTSAQEILSDLEKWQGGTGPIAAPRRKLPAKAKYWAAGGLLALALATAAVVGVRHYRAQTPVEAAPSGPVTSVAVLPLRNASGDTTLDWLGSSLAEMLGTDVGQSAHVRTVSADRIRQIVHDLRLGPDAALDPDTLRRLASFSNADVIVWGQYAKAGEQVRIDLTVQDLKQQRTVPLKAEAADQKALFSTVDILARAVRENLSLSGDAVRELQAQSFKPSTQSLDALREYTAGIDLLRAGKNREAQQSFEAAVQRDPQFALAYSKLGETYSRLGYGDKAEEFSGKAVELSQKLPQPERYRILAQHAVVAHDTKKAIEYYGNLAKSSPNDSEIKLTLAQLYQDAGAYDQARNALQSVLAREPQHAEALVALGHVEGERHNPQGALEYLNRALAIAVQMDNEALRGRVLYENGYIYRLLNKPAEALRNFQESLAVRRRLDQKAAIAQTLAEIAAIHYTQGKPDAATASYKEAVQLQRDLGDRIYLSHTLINLGNLYNDRGQYDDALKAFKESLQIQRELHNENYEAICLNDIGNVYLSTGRYDDALTYFQQALQAAEKLNVPGISAAFLYNVGDASVRLGQYDQALTSYVRALELARKAGDKQLVSLASYGMGTVFEQQGRYGAALSARQDALNSYRELQDRSATMAQVLTGYGHTLMLAGRSDEAKKTLDEALSLAREIKNDIYAAQALAYDGQRLLFSGDANSARKLLLQAQQAAKRSKDRETVLVANVGVAESTVMDGRGRTVTGELKRLADEADSLGLKYLSMQCSVDSAQALLEAKEYATARDQAEAAFKKSQKLGFLPLAAKAQYVVAQALSATGKRDEAAPHYHQAREMLQQISKEPRADAFLKRSDVAKMMVPQ